MIFFKQTVSLHNLDGTQEIFYKDTKQLILGATKESWVTYIPNVIFAQCSITYRLEEYKNVIIINNNDNSHEININRSGVAQRKNLEHVRLLFTMDARLIITQFLCVDKSNTLLLLLWFKIVVLVILLLLPIIPQELSQTPETPDTTEPAVTLEPLEPPVTLEILSLTEIELLPDPSSTINNSNPTDKAPVPHTVEAGPGSKRPGIKERDKDNKTLVPNPP